MYVTERLYVEYGVGIALYSFTYPVSFLAPTLNAPSYLVTPPPALTGGLANGATSFIPAGRVRGVWVNEVFVRCRARFTLQIVAQTQAGEAGCAAQAGSGAVLQRASDKSQSPKPQSPKSQSLSGHGPEPGLEVEARTMRPEAFRDASVSVAFAETLPPLWQLREMAAQVRAVLAGQDTQH